MGARTATVTALASLLLGGCAVDGVLAGRGAPDDGVITVFAAASLVDVLTEVAAGFEAAHPDTTVVLNIAGSATLATQINEGAPADVFISASPANMTAVAEAGHVSGTAHLLVRNQLVIVVAAGNPHRVASLADLANPDLKVALCAEQVPCGDAAARVLADTGIAVRPVTLERDVRAALSRVVLGEVDAALVYRTDAGSASEVTGIEIPETRLVSTDYQVAALAGALNPAGAQAFVDYVRSADAAAVFRTAGFQVP